MGKAAEGGGERRSRPRFTADDQRQLRRQRTPTIKAFPEWICSTPCFMPNSPGKKFKLGHYQLKVSFADAKRHVIFGSAASLKILMQNSPIRLVTPVAMFF